MVVPNQFPQANFSKTSFQSFYKNYASFFHLMQAVITMIQFISERASSSGKTLQNAVECYFWETECKGHINDFQFKLFVKYSSRDDYSQ